MNCQDCNKLLAEPNPTCAECAEGLQAELDKVNKELIFSKDAYTYLIEALKEIPEVIPKVLKKVNDPKFKLRVLGKILGGLEG